MSNIVMVIVLSLVTISFFGCASASKKAPAVGELGEPMWFKNPPPDPNYLYGVATATSRDLQMSIDKASTEATAQIGSKIELRVQALRKKFDEETGVEADSQLLQMFTKATKLVVSTSLSGVSVKEQEYKKNGEIYRAFVLMEYPIGQINKDLLSQIKSKEEIYTRYRASQTFKELEEEVKKYEDFKREQGYR